MGRILDVLRRKRSQPSTSPRSGEQCFGASSPVSSIQSRDEVNSIQSRDEIDTENEKPRESEEDVKESKLITPFHDREDRLCHCTPSLKSLDGDGWKREDGLDPTHEKYMKIGQLVEDLGDEIRSGVSGDEAHTQSLVTSRSFDSNESNDEFTEESDELALASMGDSDYSSEAAAGSVSEVTEVSDDGELRDDEGNPIDPDEAEENMLRDDEGNIIDPKTLVLRDSYVDISCESDEYYDDSGVNNDPIELISCIAEQGNFVISDDSTQSEKEAESGVRVIPLHEEVLPSCGYNHGCQDDWVKEPSSPLQLRDDESWNNTETKENRNSFSHRRKRRDHKSRMVNEEYVHIMFHNKLCTLEEESWNDSHGWSSGDESETESSWSACMKQRSTKLSSSGLFDEKFIRVRWEYSLQVMNSPFANSAALIDARDEINDMLRPANLVPDDCLQELETGEI